MTKAYIYDAVRTPRGKGKKDGSLHAARPVLLAKTVLEAIQKRNALDTTHLDEVVLGCVTQIGEQGGCIAKVAAQYAEYAENVSGLTVNRFCGSGLQAVNQAAGQISAGFQDLVVAGGVESMSRVPMGSDGGAWVIDPEVSSSFVPQGISADLIATIQGYSRKDVDRWAVRSHQRAHQAWEEGRFSRSIVPVEVAGQNIAKDETIRPSSTLESLAALRPSFEEMGTRYGFDAVALDKYPEVEKIQHVHHAGNSSGIVDGAAAVLLGNEQSGKALGLKPRAVLRSVGLVATEPTIMLTGPAPASLKALKKAKLNATDIDLIEINEAFASVVLRFIDDLKLDHEKINVNGGAIAMGHPLGATGAIILGTLLDELERKDLTLGLATLCIGGGMGIATVIERVGGYQ